MGWRARTQLLGSPSPRFIQSDETCSPSIPIQVFELAPAFVLQLCICPLYLGEGGSNPSLPCPRSSQSRSPGCGSPILWAAPPSPSQRAPANSSVSSSLSAHHCLPPPSALCISVSTNRQGLRNKVQIFQMRLWTTILLAAIAVLPASLAATNNRTKRQFLGFFAIFCSLKQFILMSQASVGRTLRPSLLPDPGKYIFHILQKFYCISHFTYQPESVDEQAGHL